MASWDVWLTGAAGMSSPLGCVLGITIAFARLAPLKMGQGREAAKAFLEEHPKELKELDQAVRKQALAS